jgi:hypothetical protein
MFVSAFKGFLLLPNFERFLGSARKCLGLFFFAGAVHLRKSVFESHAMEKVVPRIPITCEIDGKTFKGTYWIAGKILTVSTGMGGKSRQVGTTPAEELLLQLAKEGKA